MENMIKGSNTMRCFLQLQLLFFILLLSGCVPSEANLGGADHSENGENHLSVREINQQIVDNEKIKATIVEMIQSTENAKKTVTILFDLFNKKDESIIVLAENLSVDDRMVPEEGFHLRQEIAPQKTADVRLIVEEVENIEFPLFEHNFELNLQLISINDPNEKDEYNVKVIFNNET